MITATCLTKSFDGTEVLTGIDLAIDSGEYVAIMGPSGSGKSTLLNVLTGLDAPTSGTVTWWGTDLASMSDIEQSRMRLTHVGFVFQQLNLVESLSLADNIALPGLLAKKQSRSEVAQRSCDLQERTGISEVSDHLPGACSGGQRQRAGLCRALINEPRVLIGNEPTGSLNSAMSAAVLDLIDEAHGAGTTVLLVTHDPVVAARADRVLVLVDGAIVDDVDLRELAGAEAGADGRRERVAQLMLARGV